MIYAINFLDKTKEIYIYLTLFRFQILHSPFMIIPVKKIKNKSKLYGKKENVK